ncbi:MAG: DNA adenine methylase [Caldilineaceae bacterium]|nr:DNA adenine methylase [Caldilineaceae bacterium]MCB0097887.1 DNA adenine methylase [Caldilineaceae bacterium]MCB0138615.1 DNA adenine methylase [Caldilineaceae bacterium]
MSERSAKPFLKWAGGKQQLLKQFEPYLPACYARYLEPFLGGGALFFHLWNTQRLPAEVCLFDTNHELVNVYNAVRNELELLIDCLRVHQNRHSHDYYYAIRGLDRQPDVQLNQIEKAARTIYLNKTCYNGLYRVNSKGQFNVPLGSYKNPPILQEEILRQASAALQAVQIEQRDFRTLSQVTQPNDFIYFDPPYDPVSKTASFTSYTAGSFTDADQRELAETYAALAQKGCFCMLSNSHTPLVLELYSRFRIASVHASRAINSKASGRGAIQEALVLNYP